MLGWCGSDPPWGWGASLAVNAVGRPTQRDGSLWARLLVGKWARAEKKQTELLKLIYIHICAKQQPESSGGRG